MLLAGVAFTAWQADKRERETHIDDLATRVRTAANAYAASIGAQLSVVDQMLRYTVADYERDSGRFDIQFWLANLPPALSPQLSIADAEGIVRVTSLGADGAGVSIADREDFKFHRAADTGRMYVGPMLADKTTSRKSIQLSRRINDRQGRFAGIIVFSGDPGIFLEVLDRLKVGIEGTGAMLREDGSPVVRVSGFRYETDFPAGAAEFTSFVSADAAYMADFYGATTMRAARGIDDYKLVVAAEGNVPEALAEILARREIIWTAAAAVTVAILLLFFSMTFDFWRLGRLRAELVKRNAQLADAKHVAEAAVEAKSRFLANMSHELRTPLNAVLGFADLLKANLYGPLNQRQSEYVSHIQGSGRHLLELINDVLDVSRLDLNAYELKPQPIDVIEAVAAGVRTLSVAAAQKGVQMRVAMPEHLPTVEADERALKQILLNLLSNAVKFTPGGGSVEIAAALRDDGGLAVTVTDTGIGIAANDIARLFQPFQQADNVRRGNSEGTGLGLAISRRLMEKHGGTLDLESEQGKGTRAIAVFPRSRVAPVTLVSDSGAKPARGAIAA
jgi:signal transduction histidine kinase